MSALAEYDQAGQLGVLPLLLYGGAAAAGYLGSRLWASDAVQGQSGVAAKVNYESPGAQAAKLDKDRIVSENKRKLQYFQTKLDDLQANYSSFLAAPDGSNFKGRLQEMNRWRTQIQIPRFSDPEKFFVSFDMNVTRRVEDLANLNRELAAASARWQERKAKGAQALIEIAPDPVTPEFDLTRINPFPFFTTGARSAFDVAPEIRAIMPSPPLTQSVGTVLNSPYTMLGVLGVIGVGAYLLMGSKGGSTGGAKKRKAGRGRRRR